MLIMTLKTIVNWLVIIYQKGISKKRQEEAKRDKKISHTEYLEELMQK